MRDIKIILSMVNFIDIMECSIDKDVNEHGNAVISGHIQNGDEAGLLESSSEERWATITVKDEQEKTQVIFAGVVESIKIQTETGVKKATITLSGGTKLLDRKEHSRTFQNGEMTYEGVLKAVESSYPFVQHILHDNRQTAIRQFIAQYKETDWDFVKRMASHLQCSIIPFFKANSINYHIGLPSTGKSISIEAVSYSIENEVDEYFCKKENQVTGITRQDAYYYTFESREVLDLGDAVTFQNKTLFVCQVHSKIKHAELIHYYSLKSEGGFQRQRIYNTKLIGAS